MMMHDVLTPKRVSKHRNPAVVRYRLEMFKLRRFCRSLGKQLEDAKNLHAIDFGLQKRNEGWFFLTRWCWGD